MSVHLEGFGRSLQCLNELLGGFRGQQSGRHVASSCVHDGQHRDRATSRKGNKVSDDPLIETDRLFESLGRLMRRRKLAAEWAFVCLAGGQESGLGGPLLQQLLEHLSSGELELRVAEQEQAIAHYQQGHPHAQQEVGLDPQEPQ